MRSFCMYVFLFFFFNDTATTEIYTLSLHDALPIYDVLALKEADCGIAMANGSDATRAVAQLVLLDSNFSALPQVVMEGRRLINNLERVSELFLSKTVYSIILSFIFAIIFLPFPILPIQLSLIGSLRSEEHTSELQSR